MKPTITKIPFISLPDMPLWDASQNEVPIADIVDDVVLFKDGSACLVLETTSLNFGLLSEKEQQAVVAAYAALINSFTFPMQILVRSQLKDISIYLQYLEVAQSKITNPRLSVLMTGYKKFIAETIKKKNVLSKRFYIVIPFSQYELGIAKSFGAITKRKGPLPFPKSYVLKKVKTVLIPKKDHVIRQAGRLGLKIKQLTTLQLIELYYEVYNPVAPMAKKQVIGEQNG